MQEPKLVRKTNSRILRAHLALHFCQTLQAKHLSDSPKTVESTQGDQGDHLCGSLQALRGLRLPLGSDQSSRQNNGRAFAGAGAGAGLGCGGGCCHRVVEARVRDVLGTGWGRARSPDAERIAELQAI